MGQVEKFVGAEPRKEEDFIVIHPKLGVEVYPNNSGQIVIKNIGGDDNVVDQDFVYVVIEPSDAKLVAKSILAMARDIQGKTPF